MSSLSNRGATGAVKNKVQNVNSVYAGKNQSVGGKPLGRNGGLTSVGKASGVVRRMPPPATLPSLRAESQGQDPDIAIVPQGGTGWSKSESGSTGANAAAAPVTTSSIDTKPSLSSIVNSTTSGADMRPVWAKPPGAAASITSVASEQTAQAGYPSLATAAATEDVKSTRTWRTSGSMSEDVSGDLPSRFYEGGNTRPYNSSRFQGSSDARATQPGGYAAATTTTTSSAAASKESMMTNRSQGDRWAGGDGHHDYGTRDYDRNSFSDSRNGEDCDQRKNPQPLMSVDTRAPVKRNNYMSGGDDHDGHQQYSNNGSSRRLDDERSAPAPQPEYRLLKRVASSTPSTNDDTNTPQQPQYRTTTASTVAELNRAVEEEDEEEELHMTKLSKPATRVMRRVAPGQSSASGAAAAPTAPASAIASDTQRKEQTAEKHSDEDTSNKKKSAKSNQESSSSSTAASSAHKTTTAPSSPPAPEVPPPPSENIWEKRREERASAERDRAATRGQRSIHDAIQQHFPSVAEAATMRVDKDSTRKPADVDFTRVALRARRGPIVNDVRALQETEGDDAVAPVRPRQPPSNISRGNHEGYRQQRDYEQRPDYDGYRSYDDRAQRGYEPRRGGDGGYGRDRDYDRAPRDRDYRSTTDRDYGEEKDEAGVDEDYNGGPREYYNSRGGGRGSSRGQRGSGGYGPRSGHGGYERPVQSRYDNKRRNERDDLRDEGEDRRDDTAGDAQPPLEKPLSKKVIERRPSQEDTTPTNAKEGEEEQKQEEDVNDELPRGKYVSSRGRGSAVRGARGGASRGARGDRRGGSTQGGYKREERVQIKRKDVERPSDKESTPSSGDGTATGAAAASKEAVERRPPPAQTSRPTRGIYAPRGARRGASHAVSEDKRPVRSGTTDDGAATTNDGASKKSDDHIRAHEDERSSIRLKSPVVSSEGHEEWETASESSQRDHHDQRKSTARHPPVANRSKNGNNDDPTGRRQHNPNQHQSQQQPSKNGVQPASHTMHAKHEKGGGSEKKNKLNNNKNRKYQREQEEDDSEEESVNRLAGLDLADGRVIVIDNHPSTAALTAGEHSEFEEVLSKKQKRMRAEEEKARREAEELKARREKERAERIIQKKQAKMQQNRLAREERGKRGGDDEKRETDSVPMITTVWNSGQLEARATLEGVAVSGKRDADAIPLALNTAATTVVSEEAAPAVPSPIARPKAVKKPAVEILTLTKSSTPIPPVSSAAALQYEFMYDEAAAASAEAEDEKEREREKENTDSDERATFAPSETGSAVTTEDQRRLTENLSLCKNLWSSSGGAEVLAGGPGGSPSTVSGVTVSVGTVPSIVTATLPTNVAKVKPQPHSMASSDVDRLSPPVSGGICGVGGRSSSSSLSKPNHSSMTSIGGPHDMMMGGAGATMHGGMMGARSPVGMTSAFNPGFGGFAGSNNFKLFGGANDVATISNGAGMGYGGLSSSTAAPMHHGYGSSSTGGRPPLMSGMPPPPPNQSSGRPFEHSGGGIFVHPNRGPNSSSLGGGGWNVQSSHSNAFDQMMSSSTSTTPPPNSMMQSSSHHGPMGSNNGAGNANNTSRANHGFGGFGAGLGQGGQHQQQPPQPLNRFNQPPPKMGGGGGMPPPMFPPSSDMMNMPPPSLSLGAVGDRNGRGGMYPPHSGGGAPGGGSNGPFGGPANFAMPPPNMAGGPPFSRPPPPSGPPSMDIWKSGVGMIGSGPQGVGGQGGPMQQGNDGGSHLLSSHMRGGGRGGYGGGNGGYGGNQGSNGMMAPHNHHSMNGTNSGNGSGGGAEYWMPPRGGPQQHQHQSHHGPQQHYGGGMQQRGGHMGMNAGRNEGAMWRN